MGRHSLSFNDHSLILLNFQFFCFRFLSTPLLLVYFSSTPFLLFKDCYPGFSFQHRSFYRSLSGEGDGTPLQLLLPGRSHGRRSLVGCSPWGHEESDTTERLHFHFSLSCIGEGNGNPLQRSCLENPRDRGAWWAAVYGVAQSWTRLKRLSSSSSIDPSYTF